MGNYIKIPLAVNPPRSFANLFTSPGLNNTSNATGGGTVSGTGATVVSPANITTSGSGTGLGVSITKGADATIQTALITVTNITTVGEGYKAGDTITIAADTTSSNTQWDAPIVYTIVKSDLVTSSGSEDNEHQLLDVEDLLCIQGSSVFVNIFQKLRDGNTSNPLPQTIQLIFDNAPLPNSELVMQSISDAVVKAIQSPNSLPIVDLGDAELLRVRQA